MKLEPLAGFTVAVTADRRADEQAALLSRLGATVVHGPVIRTESVTDRIALLDATRSLVDRRPDVVILTTAVGVRAWLTEADSVELGDELLEVLSGPVVLARGRSVSGVAMATGLDVTWTAPTGRFSELLAHLESEKIHGLEAGARIALQLDGWGGLRLAISVAESRAGEGDGRRADPGAEGRPQQRGKAELLPRGRASISHSAHAWVRGSGAIETVSTAGER